MNKKIIILGILILILLTINAIALNNVMTKVNKIDNFFQKNDIYKMDGIILYDEIEKFKVEK